MPIPRIHVFTLIQVVALVALWVLKASSAGILFPVLIALLVPLRLGLDRWFAPHELEALDPDEELEDVETSLVGGDAHG